MQPLFHIIFLLIHFTSSLTYLIIITLIIPRISSADVKRRAFPKQPIVHYLSFYFISTFFLSVISSFPSSLTIIINLLLLAISRSIGLKLRLIGLTGQACAGKSQVIQHLMRHYNAVVISNEFILQFIRDDNKHLLLTVEKACCSDDNEISALDVHKFQLVLMNDDALTCKVESNIKWKLYWYLLKRIVYEKVVNKKQHVIIDFDMLVKFDYISVICFPIVSICNTDKDIVLHRIRSKYNYDYQSSIDVYSNQITVEEFHLKSEKVIHNEGTIEELHRKVDRFMRDMFHDSYPFIKRSELNFTHNSIVDSNISSIIPYRRSKTKFRLFLFANIFTFGFLHIASLFIPKLFLFLYCKQCSPNMSDYFLVEDAYHRVTLCNSKRKTFLTSAESNQIQSNAVVFEYNYVSYTFDEKKKSYIAVYLDLSNITNKQIHNEYGEGLNTAKEVEYAKMKYGDNAYVVKLSNVYGYFVFVEIPSFAFVVFGCVIWVIYGNGYIALMEFALMCVIVFIKVSYKRELLFNKSNNDNDNSNSNDNAITTSTKTNCWLELFNACCYCMCCKCCVHRRKVFKHSNFVKVRRKHLFNKPNTSIPTSSSLYHDKHFTYIPITDIYPGDVLFLRKGDTLPCDALILEGECIVRSSSLNGKTSLTRFSHLPNNQHLFTYHSHKNSILLHNTHIIQCISKNEDKSITVLCINTGANTATANMCSSILYTYTTERTILYSNRLYHLLINITLFAISLTVYIVVHVTQHRRNAAFLLECIFKSLSTALMPSYQLNLSLTYMYGNFNLKNNNIQCIDDSRICLAGTVSTVFLDKTGTLSEEFLTVNGYHVLMRVHAHQHHISDGVGCIVRSYKKNDMHLLSKKYLNYYAAKLALNVNEKVNVNVNVCYNEVCFIEVIATCHCLEKVDNEIYGNSIDKELFDKLKWDMNVVEMAFKDEVINCVEVYSRNYYKMHQQFLYANNESKNSFKLQIIKRFFHKSSFHISAVVFNVFTASLQFHIKGAAEEIMALCNEKTIPVHVRKLIDEYRQNGYRVIVCAYRELDMEMFEYNNEEQCYVSELCFVGFVTLRNNLKRDTKEAVDKLKQMHCEMIMCTGDIVANALAVAYECKLISNRNVFVFDVDKDNKSINVCYLSKGGDLQLQMLSMNANNITHSGQVSLVNSERKVLNDNINININNEHSLPIDISNHSNNIPHTLLSKGLLHHNQHQPDSNNEMNLSSYRYTTIPYSNSILPHIKHNSIYCISGPALSFILSNKPSFPKLLKYSHKLCKIYFLMSTSHKQQLIAYYKTLPNKTICMVGDSPNDIPALLASHIGIKLNFVSSFTNHLTHFSTNSSITCIEKLIKNGRAAYENTLLLYTSTLVATVLELLIMLVSFIMNTHLSGYARGILELTVFFLSALAFRMKADHTVDMNCLYQGKLFMVYVVVKNVVVVVLKVTVCVAFVLWYEVNPQLTGDKGKEVLMTYLLLLVLCQVLSTLFAYNRERFFRKKYLRNKALNIAMMLCVMYIAMWLTLTTRFTKQKMIKVYVFEESDFEQDNYDDRNKLILVGVVALEMAVTVVVTEGVRRCFEYKAKVNKNNNKSI